MRHALQLIGGIAYLRLRRKYGACACLRQARCAMGTPHTRSMRGYAPYGAHTPRRALCSRDLRPLRAYARLFRRTGTQYTNADVLIRMHPQIYENASEKRRHHATTSVTTIFIPND